MTKMEQPSVLLRDSETSQGYTPRSMLDGLLQRWVEDFRMQQRTAYCNVHWNASSLYRNITDISQHATLWGQALMHGIQQESNVAPVVLFATDDNATRLVIESFLGPKSMPINTDRPYTTFEQNLVERFWNHMLQTLSCTWKHWETTDTHESSLTFEWVETTQSLPILSRTYDSIMVWPLTLKDYDEEMEGTCYFIVPHITIEPLMPQLKEQFSGDSLGHNAVWHNHWIEVIGETPCRLEVRMPNLYYNLRDVLSWKVGTKIKIPPMSTAHAYCYDHHMMTGCIGHKNGYLAFQMDTFDTYKERKI